MIPIQTRNLSTLEATASPWFRLKLFSPFNSMNQISIFVFLIPCPKFSQDFSPFPHFLSPTPITFRPPSLNNSPLPPTIFSSLNNSFHSYPINKLLLKHVILDTMSKFNIFYLPLVWDFLEKFLILCIILNLHFFSATTKFLYATTVQMDDTIKKSQLKQLLNLLKQCSMAQG